MKKNDDTQDVKPDLKHDTMEYAASTDGDDILDQDQPGVEEDEISADELEILEEDDIDAQADALNTVEMERLTDNDVSITDDTEEVETEG